jgi:uncharacterized YigZ family protein
MSKKTIENNIIVEQSIEKSRFISQLFQVKNETEARDIISDIKKKHHKANHSCYAFIIDAKLKRSSDDGEPSGTAGKPILSVLEGAHLEEVLCVVTRYFGGIKLGTGGLVRAYGSSATQALDQAAIVEWTEGYVYEINFHYNLIDSVNHLLNKSNIQINNQQYFENVTYEIESTLKEEEVEDLLTSSFDNKIELLQIQKKLIPVNRN